MSAGRCPAAAAAAALPEHLNERCRSARGNEFRSRAARRLGSDPGATFVLYWMQLALRVDENPALDVAVSLSSAMGCRVVVMGDLADRWRHATLRRHVFWMQGYRDVEERLQARGVPFFFHLHRPGARQQAHLSLATAAAAVVTEEPFVEPFLARGRTLAAACRKAGTPLLFVDTACVVPPRLLPSCPARAWAFEKATKALRDARISRPWAGPPAPSPFATAVEFVSPGRAEGGEAAGGGRGGAAAPSLRLKLACSPVRLAGRSDGEIEALARRCQVDLSVAPCAHTRGGCGAASARWRRFSARALRSYDRTRNDALAEGGVSRMSAYQNAGMISPLRVAREAASARGGGAAKFLSEQQVWRELAYAYCYHCALRGQTVPAVSGLPRWAQRTLGEHAADARPALLGPEALREGRTGDALWDAAQRTLRETGELHNNLRMSWGKAVLRWTRDPPSAVAVLASLNDHFALDGLAPPGYGGILWCFGLFDGPKLPEVAVYGTVRRRPTEQQAQRFPPARVLARAAGLARGGGDVAAMLSAAASRYEEPPAARDTAPTKTNTSSAHPISGFLRSCAAATAAAHQAAS